MEQPELIRIGKVTKSFGTRGELIIELQYPGLELSPGEPLFLSLEGTRVPFFIEGAMLRPDGKWQVSLDDISEPEQVRRLIHSSCYLEKHHLPEPSEGEMHISDLVGFRVTDARHGDLGIIIDILDYPEQDMMEIENESITFLIPLIEEYILEIDPEDRRVDLDCPEGLIDILRGEGE